MANRDDYAANILTTGKLIISPQGFGDAKGTTETATDHDWFAVSLKAGKHYGFNASGYYAFVNSGYLTENRTLAIHDASGAILPSSSNINDALIFTPKKSGIYYLDVSASRTTIISPNYSLSVHEKKDDYGNYLETAYNIKLTQEQTVSINGHFEEQGDQDWFKIQCVAGGYYKIAFHSTDAGGIDFGSSNISIRDSNNTNVAQDYDSDNKFIFTAPTTGTYYVEVDSFFGNTLYTLDITKTAKNDDYGNDQQTAEALSSISNNYRYPGYNANVTGHFESAGDHDWFSVHLDPDRAYRLSTFSHAILRNASGEILATDSSGTGYFDYAPTQSGTYYLDVSATDQTQTGIYFLSIALLGDDYPNHISGIEPIVVGDSAGILRNDSLNNQFDILNTTIPDDHDWVPVQLSANKSYTINAYDYAFNNNYYLLNNSIALRDNTGELVPNRVSQGSSFAFSSPSSGLYYLDFSYLSTQYTPNYPFKITSYQDDYVDNTTSKGHLALPGKQAEFLQGTIEVSGDHDWIKVPLLADRQYVFSVNSLAKDTLEFPLLHIYDADGKALVTANTSQISFVAPLSGSYYVEVLTRVDNSVPFVFYPPGTPYTGEYTLTAIQKNDDYSNTRANAQVFDLTAPNAEPLSLIGSVEKRGDHDWLAVKLLAGKSYHFELSGTGLQPNASVTLVLYNAKGGLIDSVPQFNKSTFSIDYSSSDSGLYYLDISALRKTDTGSYTLSITNYYDIQPSHPYTATPLEAGSTLSGQLGFSGDHDWFPVHLVKGNYYYFSSYQLYSFDTTPLMVLRDATGKLIPNAHLQTSGFLANKSGTFYLDVTGASDHYYQIQFTTYPARDDYSNNALTSGKLALSSDRAHSVTGVWESPPFSKGDADWFKVSLQEGQNYIFVLSIDPTADISDSNRSLSLITVHGITISPTTYTNTSPNNIIISFVASYTGTYYLNPTGAWQHEGAPISYKLIGQQNAPVGTDQANTLTGGTGADILLGLDGNELIRGGAGNDILNGGAGKDVMVGGSGNDTYYIDNNADSVKETSANLTEIDTIYNSINPSFNNITNYTLPPNVENLILAIASNDFVGIGNQLNNTLILQPSSFSSATLKGQAGNDTLINLDHSGHPVNFYGGNGNDKLVGLGHFIGGAGKDTYEFNLDYEHTNNVEISRGESLPTKFDVVKGFVKGATLLTLDNPYITVDISRANGKDVGLLHSHRISNGIISFDNIDIYKTPLVITADKLDMAIKYIQANITTFGDTVAFIVGNDTYVFQDGGTLDTLVELVGVTAYSIQNTVTPGSMLLF